MTGSEKKQASSSRTMTKLLLFSLILAAGFSSSTKAQELVKGTFTLGTEARFGGTLLPAGHYTVSVEPVTSVSATSSRVLVFVRSENKSRPVASVFALASTEACDTPSGLTLLSDGTGLAARSLCFSKQGIMIAFDLSRFSETPKVKAVASVRP
jgi:hypothetical protein